MASQWLRCTGARRIPSSTDAILRLNALNCFADSMAVVDGVRRVALVRSRQHGTFSLRDIDIATSLSPGEGDAQVNETRSTRRSGRCPWPSSRDSTASQRARVLLQKIDARMRATAGTEATPGFDPLVALKRMSQVLRVQLASHPESAAAGLMEPRRTSTVPRRAWRSRQVAAGRYSGTGCRRRLISAHGAVGPIPLFLARQAGFKDFLEVLADIAPEAVAQAAAGGLPERTNRDSGRFARRVVSWPVEQ